MYFAILICRTSFSKLLFELFDKFCLLSKGVIFFSNDKAAIFDNLAAVAWKNLFNVYWLVKNGWFVIRKFKMHIEERINSTQTSKMWDSNP